MPDIGKMLREEIARLARREVRSQTSVLGKQVRDLKKVVVAQKKLIAKMQKALKSAEARPRGTRQPTPPAEEKQDIRISPASIQKHRSRLGLTQKQLGTLLGVSTVTIGNWESGKAKPQGRNRQAVADFRQLTVREAEARLAK